MIYFMQPVDGGPVKIGYTENLDKRRRTLESMYGKQLAVIGELPGGISEEQSIHARFAHLRFGRSEQFRPEPDLMEFIGRPAAARASAVSQMGTRGQTCVVKFSDSLYGRLQAAARREGNSVPSVIRRAVVMELERIGRETEVSK